MTNQQKQTKARQFGFIKLATVALALVAMICCLSILTSAAEAPAMSLDEHFAINMNTENGVYVKEYDGTAEADITLNAAGVEYLKASLTALTPEELALIDFGATATFNSVNVTEASQITVVLTATAIDESAEAVAAAQKAAAMLPASLTMPGRVTPKVLAWKYTSSKNYVSLACGYVWGQADYTIDLNTASLPKFVSGEEPGFASQSTSVVLKNVQLSDLSGSGIAQDVTIALADPNYEAEPLKVVVEVRPIQITKITWVDYDKLSQYTFAYGDTAAHLISAMGTTADGNAYPLTIEYPANYGNVGAYDVTAIAPAGFAFADGVSATTRVTVQPRTYTVSMNNASFIGTAGNQTKPTVFNLTVSGEIPADIRALITYTNNGQSAYGTYEVVATLPESANFSFVNAAGEKVTSLTATMQIRKAFITAENAEMPYQVILSSSKGFLDDVKATLTLPGELSSIVTDEFPYYKAYTVSIVGTQNGGLTMTLPISSELYAEGCATLTADDLYVYNFATGTLTHATEVAGLTVTVLDGCYQVSGIAGDSETTFVVAPAYSAPFWGSVWSILMIIGIVLVLLGGMMALGFFRLRRSGAK